MVAKGFSMNAAPTDGWTEQKNLFWNWIDRTVVASEKTIIDCIQD